MGAGNSSSASLSVPHLRLPALSVMLFAMLSVMLSEMLSVMLSVPFNGWASWLWVPPLLTLPTLFAVPFH